MGKGFVREKRIVCGKEFQEVDIFSYSDGRKQATKGKRKKREYITLPKQQDINDRNAERRLNQHFKANFTEKDIHMTLTYTNKHLPKTLEDGEKEIANYIRRFNYRRKKEGLEKAKYILVTETGTDESGNPVRMHHHLVISGGLDRDVMEDLWRKPIKKGQKQGDKIGFSNADRLEPNEDGSFIALATYLTKRKETPKYKKRWTSSHNLVRPYEEPPNDTRYSVRQIKKLAMLPSNFEYWEKKYTKFDITSVNHSYNDENGWAIYLTMRKKE